MVPSPLVRSVLIPRITPWYFNNKTTQKQHIFSVANQGARTVTMRSNQAAQKFSLDYQRGLILKKSNERRLILAEIVATLNSPCCMGKPGIVGPLM